MAMYRTLVGLLALLLVVPALGAFDDKDKPKGQPATPAEQYQALVKEYEQAEQAHQQAHLDDIKAIREGKSQEERNKALRGKMPPRLETYARRFLELAKKYPKNPVALDALFWVVQAYHSPPPPQVGRPPGNRESREAEEILLRDHAQDSGMVRFCPKLLSWNHPVADQILQAVLDRNPDHNAQGIACYVLAARRHRKAIMAELVHHTGEAKKIRQEVAQLFDRLAREYTAVPLVRQMVLVENTPAPPQVIRAVLAKTTDRDIKGRGTYLLALRLKQAAEQAAKHDRAAEAETLSQEAEQILERVAKEYADVPGFGNRKLGELAQDELYVVQLRHLAVGKPAPEIDGEDVDGRRFKLSDYKGKVVLLGFWGHW
jgi:hypothetical protein